MLLRSKLLLSLAVFGFGAALVAPQPAAAMFILDDFDAQNNPITTNCASSVMCTPTPILGVGDFGADRKAKIENLSTLIINGGSSLLNYNGVDTDAGLTLTYDNFTTVDITGGFSTLNLDFILGVVTLSEPMDVDLTITDGLMASYSVPFTINSTGDFHQPLQVFVDNGVDLTDVAKIELVFEDAHGLIELDYLLTPEPSTAAMLLLGLAGLSCAGRRQESAC